jgi:hemerythrin-like domain-containing protein
MADAFSVLRRDHEKVERTLAVLEDGPNAGSGADQGELLARRKLTQQLIIDETVHEAIEEQYFWPVVRDRLPGGSELADEAIGQEQDGKQVLDQLDKLEAWDDGFEKLLREFISAARDHVAFEETKVWPGLREALSTEEINELGDKMAKARQSASS